MVSRLVASYPRHDAEFDRKLEKASHRECLALVSASWVGKRDVGWTFKKRDAAYKASRILRTRRRRGVKVFAEI